MNAVLPCATETEGFARNGRIGGAEAVRDFANALGPDGPARRYRQCGRLLASSDAAWINGQLIPVSRGVRLSKKNRDHGVTFAGAERTRE